LGVFFKASLGGVASLGVDLVLAGLGLDESKGSSGRAISWQEVIKPQADSLNFKAKGGSSQKGLVMILVLGLFHKRKINFKNLKIVNHFFNFKKLSR
jgi:hypothetical protein